METVHKPLFDPLLVTLVKAVDAQVLVDSAILEEMIGDKEQSMCVSKP